MANYNSIYTGAQIDNAIGISLNLAAWAKGANKPSYAWSEITSKPAVLTTSNANTLSSGSSDLTDSSEILTSYASDNGFSDTNAPGVIYRRPAVKMYNYIKTKLAISSSNNTASWGNAVVVGTIGGVQLKFTLPSNPETNTWRKVQLNGTDKLGTGVDTNPLNLKAGTNVTITESSGTFTFAATDTTYESKTAASGGTAVSLVTTGEKYTWNNKVDKSGTSNKSNYLLSPATNRLASANLDDSTYTDAKGEALMRIDLSTGSMTIGKPSGDGFIQTLFWDNASYDAQFYIPNNSNCRPQLRYHDNSSTWSDWKSLAYLDDLSKYVRFDTNAQGLTDAQKGNARTNIGAGTSNFSGSYNDLSNKPTSLPASDVYAWAKASSKPSYDFSEINKRYESYLGWGGGQSRVGSFGPLDACLVSKLGANRVAGISGDYITIERSNDSGSTWSTVSTSTYTNAQRKALFTTNSTIQLKYGSANATTDRLRITMDATNGSVYTGIQKIMMYISTNGSSGCQVLIETAYYGSPTTWRTVGTYGLSGWSGWNVMNLTLPGSSALGGSNSSEHNRFIRFTFSCTGVNTSYDGLTIYSIYMFGGVGWTTPSTLAANGVPYSYDENANVTFPNYVNAPVIRPTTCILLQNTTNYLSGIYYHAASNESVVFANKYNVTSWIFANADPTARPDWQTLTPALQIKNQRVAINKLIAAGANANYQLDVNGTMNATTIYENGTAIDTIIDNKIAAAITGAIADEY